MFHRGERFDRGHPVSEDHPAAHRPHISRNRDILPGGMTQTVRSGRTAVAQRPQRGRERVDLVELWALGQAVDQLVRSELARHGLSGGLLAVLAQVARGPVTTSELAVALGQAFMTTSDQVDRLEAAGEIVREANPADGRSKLIRLTARGHRRLRETGPHIAGIERTILMYLAGRPAVVLESVTDLRRALELAISSMGVER
jgi:DNA-binding MarR family transcriptional regulator